MATVKISASQHGDAPERDNRRSGMTVSDVHAQLKEMVILFKIKPGERVNEGELADRLGISRTPLREALHRLVAENMLTMVPNRGFYGRQLASQEVFDLYELRSAIEATAIRLAVKRASDEDIRAVRDAWMEVMRRLDALTPHQVLLEDENFHISVARLSGNQEIVKSLQTINARIHYFRWSDVEDKGNATGREHLALANALLDRDLAQCEQIIQVHISRRMDEIVSFVKSSLLRLYGGDL